jgi:DNA-packaging protein gp3
MKEKEPLPTPQIINEINEYLRKIPPEDHDMENFTVEGIAEGIGVSKNILYGWVKTDTEFSETLGRLKNVQQNDPFKTGTFFDTQVNAMMIALLLMETKERHFRTDNS